MQLPSTATEARSFLGLVNTVACFVPNLTAMTEPTWRITHKNHPWLWGLEQSQAFNKLCDLISSDTVLAHFDPSLLTQVRHEACKIGISGALTQKHPDGSIQPVAYASRSLSPVEQCYSQIEREALSRVWACERFHFYIHGSQFDLHQESSIAVTSSKQQFMHCLSTWHTKCCWLFVMQTCHNQHTQRSCWGIC